MPNLSNYIDGAWLAGSGRELATIDPSTGRQTWTSNESTGEDVGRAVAAARAAFEAWALTPLEQRIAIATRFRDLLKEHSEELAATIAEEVGKPLWEARTEVTTMANKIDISVQSYGSRTGETANKVADGNAVLRHRPDWQRATMEAATLFFSEVASILPSQLSFSLPSLISSCETKFS